MLTVTLMRAHAHTHTMWNRCIYASPATLLSTIVFTGTSDRNKRFSYSLPPLHPHTYTDKNPTKCSIFCRCVVIYERCFSQQADSPVWNASFHKSILHSHFSASPPPPPLLFPLLSPVQDSLSHCWHIQHTVCVRTCLCVCVWVRECMDWEGKERHK